MKIIKEGRLLLRPNYCPMEIYDIMLGCWKNDPNKRLSFDSIHTFFISFQLNSLRPRNLAAAAARTGDVSEW